MFAAASTNPGMRVPWASKRARPAEERRKGKQQRRRPHRGLHLLFARVTSPLFHSSKAPPPAIVQGPQAGLVLWGGCSPPLRCVGPGVARGRPPPNVSGAEL